MILFSLNKVIKYWAKYLLIAMLFMSFSRIVFLIYHIPELDIQNYHYALSLINGLRFDFATFGYFFLPVYFILLIITFPLLNKISFKFFPSIIKLYSLFLLILFTSLYILDIGFFTEYFTRINYIAIEYLSFFDSIAGTVIYQFPYNVLLLALLFIILIQIKFSWKRIQTPPYYYFQSYLKWVGVMIAMTFLILLMIRGGFQNKPLNWSHTNITPYRFTNQLSVNPIWNMGMTWKTAISEQSTDKYSNLNYPLEKAFVIARKSVQSLDNSFISLEYPLLRETKSSVQSKDYNVVIILMEAFAGSYTGVLGDTNNITPYFDALSKEGVLFTRMYSSGTRTNRGLSGTLL